MHEDSSLLSTYLFGKFFDPADAIPLWKFEAEVLLAALRRGARTIVGWAETDSEYYLRADIPGPSSRDLTPVQQYLPPFFFNLCIASLFVMTS